MKFESKQRFLEETEKAWAALWVEVGQWNSAQVLSKFSPSKTGKAKKKSQADLRSQSVADVLAHLHDWHLLLLGWHKAGLSGAPVMPAAGYKWNETRRLNRDLADQWKDVAFDSIRRRLKLSHGRVIKLVVSLSNKQFMKPGHYEWTGKYGFVSYVGPNTFSHYRWATKKLVGMRKLV